MAARPLVLVTEHLDDEPFEWLAERCDVRRTPNDSSEFVEALPGAAGLVVRTYTRVDPSLLTIAKRLCVVGRAGVGLDNIDLPSCAARDVRVVHTPDANTQAVVEYTIALMLDGVRPRLFLGQALPPRDWEDLRRELRAGRELCELTIGVLGFGRIGQRVAPALAGLMDPDAEGRVIYHDIRPIPESSRWGAAPVGLDELLRESDVLTVHVDGRPENRSLLSERELSLLGPQSTVINTSRGFVVEPDALAAFLQSNPEARAILDVHQPEPIGEACPLLPLPNAHLAPHIAGATARANRAMSWVVRDVWRVLDGQEPVNSA